ncbi:hypothetical protein AB4Y32_28285 [Paraburkholderia phymatum]|uniref:Uncharacterized protein n=1 Tax=Paraburkholderia phymatum TaxID=148447 RepID=A0ACC6U7M2_9BURK
MLKLLAGRSRPDDICSTRLSFDPLIAATVLVNTRGAQSFHIGIKKPPVRRTRRFSVS